MPVTLGGTLLLEAISLRGGSERRLWEFASFCDVYSISQAQIGIRAGSAHIKLTTSSCGRGFVMPGNIGRF